MAFSTLTNFVRMTTATTGTGTVTLGSALTGFIAAPAALDGKSVTYELSDPGPAPTAREVGRGVYTNSGTTLTRATVLASTSGGSKISLSGRAYVSLTLADDDLQNLNPVSITCQAGTNISAPLDFTSGTNLTSASNGAIEYDGNAIMFTPSATSRGAVPAVQFIALTASYTLTNTTSAQKLFNVPSAGSLTVTAGTRYAFECLLYLTSTATPGTTNTKFDIIGAGTATFTSSSWCAIGVDNTTPGTAVALSGTLTATNISSGNIVVGVNSSGVFALITGQFRVNQGGTIIPTVALTAAAAAVVQPDCYFTCWPLSAAATGSLGNWA